MTGQSQVRSQVYCWLLAWALIAAAPALAQDLRVRNVPHDILADQKQIWSSPFRMTRRNAKWWLIFGAATGALIATDRRSSRQLPNTQDQLAASRGVSHLGAVYTLAPVAGGLYLSGVLAGQSKLRNTGLLGAEALVDGLIVAQALKMATGRQRPIEGDGGAHFWHGGNAFPSGHSVESFALASVIVHQYSGNKVVAVLAYGLAAAVGASRFSARQHSASDIVAGAAVGWFIGRQVSARSRLLPRLAPNVESAGHSYGLSLTWHP